MQAYYCVYEKYLDEISAKARTELMNHPVFGKLIRDIPSEMAEAREKVTRELQKGAIMQDYWEPYINYQIEQGIIYARMGLSFYSWYELVSLVRDYILPYLQREYGTGAAFQTSVNGLNNFLDIGMCIIGEAYVHEKNEKIIAEREVIQKQNEELEQKVTERTLRLQDNLRQLKESEEKYSFLFNSMDEGYCIIEMIFDDKGKPVDYRFLETNASFENQTGLKDANGKRMREFAPDHEDHWFEIYGKVATTGVPVRFQNRAEQLHRWYDVFACRFGAPENLQVAILFNDITTRKKTEEKLQEVNKDLEAFTYSVSHDLRAPLRAINGYAQMLIEDHGPKLDQEGRRITDIIRNNALKMGTLIDDLLAFSKLGRQEIRLTKINMDELTESVLKEMPPHKAEIKTGKLHTVEADYSLVKQVMINLIANALKYSSGKQKPVVEISSKDVRGRLVFTVKDNGAGFDMKYYDKLFRVFQRLHSPAEFEGVGVGLAIVKRIIAKHGGKVWAEGIENEGAIFSFSLKKPKINK
ncbi:MAG: hypothetical protein H6581_16740 [Bacteroidia bacterium]|nr:hypothetical protein [Bacteroidia bacterium]